MQAISPRRLLMHQRRPLVSRAHRGLLKIAACVSMWRARAALHDCSRAARAVSVATERRSGGRLPTAPLSLAAKADLSSFSALVAEAVGAHTPCRARRAGYISWQ